MYPYASETSGIYGLTTAPGRMAEGGFGIHGQNGKHLPFWGGQGKTLASSMKQPSSALTLAISPAV